MPDKEVEPLKRDNEEIEIEIVEDDGQEPEAKAEPEAPREESREEAPQKEEKASDDDLSNISESVKKRIDKLTFKMREAERREQAAIEYAKSLKGEVDAYRTRTTNLSQSWEAEFDGRLKSQQELAADKLRSAVDRGDVDAQIEAQKQIAALVIEEERLKTFRLQRQAPQPQQQYAQQPVQQAPASPKPDRKAEDWAQRNEWFGEDQAMTATALSFHKTLVEQEGYDPSSDDYYDELDRRIRKEFSHKFEKKEPAKPAPAVASARPSARPDNGKKQIKLTSSQIALARKLGITVEEYARQVQKLAR